jgi:membrane-associated phospholipid phosphatase
LAATLPPLVVAIAKLDLPLQDSHFARVDELLGIGVPRITSWSSHHRVGALVNRTHPLLSPLLTLSVFLPALAGKTKNAQQFVMANLVAFSLGLPLFAFLPAVGPWYGYGFTPTPDQIECQRALLFFRGAGHFASRLDAIICFPSFHVIWAIFCVAALWGFRFLRIPVSLFAGLIIISTVTTGWHYFIDVLGGIVVAGLSLAIAKACIETSKDRSQYLEARPTQ